MSDFSVYSFQVSSYSRKKTRKNVTFKNIGNIFILVKPIWFYWLGLSVYNPRDSDRILSRFALIRKSLPSICFLLITVLSGIFSLHRFPSKNRTFYWSV